jgi:hypothetical protein
MKFIKVLPCKWIKKEYIVAVKVIENPYSVLLISPHGGLPDLFGEYKTREDAEKSAKDLVDILSK